MSAAAFYILAAVIVVAALLAVGMPRAREAALALLGLTTLSGILAMASGAYLTGVLEVVLPALTIGGIAFAVRATGQVAMLGQREWPLRTIVIAGVTSLVLLVILLIAFAGNGASFHRGSGSAPLLTLLHLRAPFAFVAALVSVVTGVAGLLLIGRRGADEREYDRTHEARREREARAQRRREDRAAARRGRGSAPGPAG